MKGEIQACDFRTDCRATSSRAVRRARQKLAASSRHSSFFYFSSTVRCRTDFMTSATEGANCFVGRFRLSQIAHRVVNGGLVLDGCARMRWNSRRIVAQERFRISAAAIAPLCGGAWQPSPPAESACFLQLSITRKSGFSYRENPVMIPRAVCISPLAKKCSETHTTFNSHALRDDRVRG